MKRIVPFLFLLASINAAAQNYSPFKPGVLYVYLTAYEKVWQKPPNFTIEPVSHTIFCDTFYAINNDSVFLNYKHLSYSNGFCYKLNREFFLGKCIIKKSNGDYLFPGTNNDTILIKTQVALNDTFVYLSEAQHPDSNYLAVVKSKQIETFEGATDSVITYAIVRVNAIKQEIPSPSNGRELKISKQFGCIQWLYPGDSTELRPSHCSDRVFGKPYPSVKQLSSYEVGDVFDYRFINTPYNPTPGFYYVNPYERRRIISKEATPNNDTIKYKIEISTIYLNQKPRKIEYDTLDVMITTSDEDEIWCLHKSFNASFFNLGFGSYMNILLDSLGFSLEVKKDLSVPTYPDSCYHPPLDGITPSLLFRPGFGLVYSVTPYSFSESAQIKELFYYKKGNVIWGTPIDFNILLNQDHLPEANALLIYPNPVQDILSIEWNVAHPVLTGKHTPVQFALYDLVGKEVLVSTLNEGKNELKLSSLPGGVYFYTAQSEMGATLQGKIIKK